MTDLHPPPFYSGHRCCRGGSANRTTVGHGACAKREDAYDRLQRRAAFVGSDGRAVRGQPDHSIDLQVRVRLVHRPEPRSFLQAGPAHQVGLEQGQDESSHERAQGGFLARRDTGHAGRRRVVAGARGRPEERQSDPVRLGQDRQLQSRRRCHHGGREGVRADAVQVDGVPHRLRAAEEGVYRGRRGRVRERSRSARVRTWWRSSSATRTSASKPFRSTGVRSPRSRPSCSSSCRMPTSRFGRGRERGIRSHARAAVRGIRAPDEDAQPHRRRASGIGHRHDLHHEPRRRCWTRTCAWR